MNNSRRRPAQAEARPATRYAAPESPRKQRADVASGRPRRYARSSLAIMAALMLVPVAPADANNFTDLGGKPAAAMLTVVAGARG